MTEGSRRSIAELTDISISKFFRFLSYSLERLLDSPKDINFSIFLSNTRLTYSGDAILDNPWIAFKICFALPL